MPLKTISQRKFLKGVGATFPKWEQPPGFLPRLSNLLMTDRGGLKTCDGSLIISALNGSIQTNLGPFTELFLFQPVNVARYYVGIFKDINNPLGLISNLAVADGGAGGTLANATYRYEVTSLDGAGGETTVSNEASFANPGAHLANLSWTAVTNAVSYNVYRTAAGGASGSEVFLTNVTTNSFSDNGSITPGTATPPSINNTQQCDFVKIPATSWSTSSPLFTLPADFVPIQDGTPGGGGGGGGGVGGGGSGNPPNPSGGLKGNISPIPQIIQFNNQAVLALGNGYNPLLFTDPSTVAALSNNFTATYPNWITATAFATGSIIKPTTNNAGGFVFTAIQGGISGAGNPTFPQTQGQTVADNNIIWKNNGVTTSSPAPRGAAHAEVYAGSLWLANTSPTTTADQLDGPTVIKMSDLNNPNSWNPLNTAFIGRDDGDVITGMKSFTVAAQGIAPTGSLLVFKYFKTYQVIGVFGAADFAIQETQSDMGCIASRSIQFLPGFGIARLTHLGVAVFDGVNDRLISEEIRPYLFTASSQDTQPGLQALDQNFAYFAKGAQCADPPMYMLAIPLILGNLSLTGISVGFGVRSFGLNPGTYFYRFTKFVSVSGQVTESFVSVEGNLSLFGGNKFTITASDSNVDISAIKYRMYIGTSSGAYTFYMEMTPAQFAAGVDTLTQGTTNGALQASTGGMTRILCYDMVLKAWTVIDLPFSISVLKQFRAVGTEPITVIGGFTDGTVRRLQLNDTTWDGAAINWLMTSAEVFGKAASARIYYRKLTIRGTTTNASLSFKAITNLDGTDGVTTPANVYLQGNIQGTYDFLAQVDLGQTNYNSHITLTGTGNIEITSLDWTATSLPEGVPPVL